MTLERLALTRVRIRYQYCALRNLLAISHGGCRVHSSYQLTGDCLRVFLQSIVFQETSLLSVKEVVEFMQAIS